MKRLYTLVLLIFCMVGVVHSAETNEEVQQNINTLITRNQCSGCNLSGADLNRLDLSGADLSGADLSGATFFLADLSGANLKNCILRGVQFGGADLAGADLSGADMRGAVLNGAYLSGTIMDGRFENKPVTDDSELKDIQEKVYISDTKEPKEAVESREVEIKTGKEEKNNEMIPVARGADASTLQEVPPAPPVKKAIPVQSVTIDSKNMGGPVEPVKMEKTGELTKVEDGNTGEAPETIKKPEPQPDETNETLVQEKVEETSLSSQAEKMLEKLKDEKKCYKCSFAGVDLSGVDLDDADLEGIDFTGARLEGADFEGANLKGAVFRNADLRNAKFKGADLYKADFSNSDVTGADFKDAEMDEALFTGTKGYQVNLMKGAE